MTQLTKKRSKHCKHRRTLTSNKKMQIYQRFKNGQSATQCNTILLHLCTGKNVHKTKKIISYVYGTIIFVTVGQSTPNSISNL